MAANQARIDLAKKLRFEIQFRRQVRRAFFMELGIFRRQIVPEGQLTNPEELSALWLRTVLGQYNRVVPAFSIPIGLDPVSRDILDDKLQTFIRNSSIQDSGFITRTSTKNMLLARVAGVTFLNENKVPVTQTSLTRVGSRILRRLQRPRAENITVTETQSAAEGSKKITSKVEEKNRKEWITVSDSKVRPAHISAHGQVRFMDNPFDIGGDKLGYPGDTSLGARVGNVAYCRCAAIYG